MSVSVEEATNLATSGEILNMYPTFITPDGPPPDPEPFITVVDKLLPGWPTSNLEFVRFVAIVGEGIYPDRPLPSLLQLARITVAKESGCWELPVYKGGMDVYPDGSPLAGKSRARYGVMRVSALDEALAHRVMYKIFRGDIAEKAHIDHICLNKSCCFHRHLEQVTPAENTRRGREDKRAKRGELPLFQL